jgi:hypothetical protein
VSGLLAKDGPTDTPRHRRAAQRWRRASPTSSSTGPSLGRPSGWRHRLTGPAEKIEDSGFIYYARHYRSGDGSVPAMISGLLTPYGSVSVLTLPADNGTWGLGLICSARDRALHNLSHADVWERTVRAFPLVAHWIDAEPITDIQMMAKIEDRQRTFVVDGLPVVTGLVPLGDAWACTNPSLGRGISIGMMHAAALHDLVRDGPVDDARAQAQHWATLTNERVEGFVADTIAFDRHRLAEIDAFVEGRAYETDDPGWGLAKALEASALSDPELLRGFFDVAAVNVRGVDVLSRPGLAEKAITLADPTPPPGPDRAELLALTKS